MKKYNFLRTVDSIVKENNAQLFAVAIIVDNTAKEKSAHMAVMEHTAANIVELVLSAVGLI